MRICQPLAAAKLHVSTSKNGDTGRYVVDRHGKQAVLLTLAPLESTSPLSDAFSFWNAQDEYESLVPRYTPLPYTPSAVSACDRQRQQLRTRRTTRHTTRHTEN
eukprot:3098880-Rhodomonas_salina.2